ncbi:MAG: hypothetical protein AAB500_00860 [Patescibacteria group bacterium]
MKLKFTIFSLLLLPLAGFALSPSAINVSVFPQSPAPGENVTITLSSYGANLDIVNIIWQVNGKTVLSGIGMKSYLLTAGAAGVEAKVVARVMLPEGEIDKLISIRPGAVVLLWQANDSYVPPFYKGKALPTEGSEIKIVAVPEIRAGGATLDPKTLNYVWKKNYENSSGDSGYGKNYLLHTSDYLDPGVNVSVVAGTVDGKYASGGSISVGAYEPEIAFYKVDPVLGTLWEHALPDPYRLASGETLLAAPYFIAPADIRRPELVFKWFINNSMLPVQIVRKNLIPLAPAAGASGTSRVRLEIENTDQIFSSASGEINIEF